MKNANNKMRRISAAAFILTTALIPFIALFHRTTMYDSGVNPFYLSFTSGILAQELEAYVKGNLPFYDKIESIGVNIRYIGGSREQNGVFIVDDTLIKNMDQPQESVLQYNNNAIIEFAQNLRGSGKTLYFTIIPTASGVFMQNLPYFAQIIDQRPLIDDIYGAMSGKVTAIDTFLPLYAKRDQYIFYRTEDNLTAYGGYAVYSALAQKMRVMDNPSYNYFDIDYAKYDYYGDIYALSPFASVTPDTLIQFKFSRHVREYTVTHRDSSGVKTYHTLYPEHFLGGGNDMNIYLGGLSAVTDIKTSAPFARKLLLFGDKTALSYLPFLVNHYQQVTFIDLFHNYDLFSDIDIEEYDQILMAYGIETYISPVCAPSRVMAFAEQ